MNKYRDKSDFEINKAVAEIYLHGKHLLSEEKQEVYFAGMDGGDFLPNGYFDPCNNPADAMTIILDNKIDLTHLVGNMVCAKHKEYWCIRKNPYRAGCEVYLLMKEAENENEY
ncbi:MAG: phage protein NinX family protein [Morganella sp. (in: enterobacteria)]